MLPFLFVASLSPTPLINIAPCTLLRSALNFALLLIYYLTILTRLIYVGYTLQYSPPFNDSSVERGSFIHCDALTNTTTSSRVPANEPHDLFRPLRLVWLLHIQWFIYHCLCPLLPVVQTPLHRVPVLRGAQNCLGILAYQLCVLFLKQRLISFFRFAPCSSRFSWTALATQILPHSQNNSFLRATPTSLVLSFDCIVSFGYVLCHGLF